MAHGLIPGAGLNDGQRGRSGPGCVVDSDCSDRERIVTISVDGLRVERRMVKPCRCDRRVENVVKGMLDRVGDRSIHDRAKANVNRRDISVDWRNAGRTNASYADDFWTHGVSKKSPS